MNGLLSGLAVIKLLYYKAMLRASFKELDNPASARYNDMAYRDFLVAKIQYYELQIKRETCYHVYDKTKSHRLASRSMNKCVKCGIEVAGPE